MAWKYIKVSRETGLCTITLNRPEVLNALNKGMFDEMDMVFSVITAMSNTNVLVFSGAEDRAFSVGADINELAAMSPEDFDNWLVLNQTFFGKIASLEIPVIAALNGYTLGGGLELALACDLRIAKEGIELGLPEARLGVIPGTGGTQRLARLVGPGIAKDLIFTGRRVKAEEALRLGIVNQVIPTADWPQAVYDLAKEIADRAPIALRSVKQCIAAAGEYPLQESLDMERRLNVECFKSDDFREGLAAFREKRAPFFRGK